MNAWFSVQPITKMLHAGGWMMPILVCVGTWIGYLLVLRTLELRLASSTLKQIQSQNNLPPQPHQVPHHWVLTQQKMILERAPIMRQTLIASAPLLGLLGTVAGMITTFSSLGEGVWVDPSGGIAGGISQALLTTQLGLGIALPSLLWQRLLQRRAQRLLLSLKTHKENGGSK